MSVENLEKMLANAPDVAKWWDANKQSIETSMNVKGKWEERLLKWAFWTILGSCCSLMIMIALCLSLQLKEFKDIVLSIGNFCVLVAFIGVGFGACGLVTAQCRWASFSRHYKEAANRWGWSLDPHTEGKEFSQQHRANLVAQLNDFGVDPHHIVALRNLDLPNAWWHALNEEIVRTQHEKPQSTPTLEDVFVHVEQRTQAAKNHVLRL